MAKIIKCKICGENKPHKAKGLCHKCWGKKYYEENTEQCKKQAREYREENREQINEHARNRYYELYGKLMEENKDCALFLGVHIAEKVLSKVFKDVQRMSPNNSGFDFVCNRRMKIDVKSSVLRKDKRRPNHKGLWIFNIKKNTIADYFLCLAFDNREDLNPLYMWLIPGKVVNHLVSTSISPLTLSKWSKYEKDISKVEECCNTIRNNARK